MSSRTNPGQENRSVASLESPFDHHSLPQPARLRSFAPLAAGDIQTAMVYLANSLVRVQSMVTQGETWTEFEHRAVRNAIDNARESLAILTDHLTSGTPVFTPECLSRFTVRSTRADGTPVARTVRCVLERGQHEHTDGDGHTWTDAKSANSNEAR